jgi:hypothetical protein
VRQVSESLLEHPKGQAADGQAADKAGEEEGGEMTRAELHEAYKLAVHDMRCLGAFLVRLVFFMGLSWGIVALTIASWAADGNPLDRPLSSVNISTLITVAAERILLTLAGWGVLVWGYRSLRRLPWQDQAVSPEVTKQ